MFNAHEAAEVTVPRLELVKRAGKQYAETVMIDEKLLVEICSTIIPQFLSWRNYTFRICLLLRWTLIRSSFSDSASGMLSGERKRPVMAFG